MCVRLYEILRILAIFRLIHFKMYKFSWKLINEIQFRCLPILDTLAIANEDQKKGVEIVRHALKQPCFTIASNAGLDASVIVNKVETYIFL